MNDRKVCPMVAGRAILSAYCSAITQQLYYVCITVNQNGFYTIVARWQLTVSEKKHFLF